MEAQQQAEQADLVDDEILLLASQRYEEEAQQQAETASQLEVVAEEKEDGPLLQASEVRSSRWGNPVSLDDITDVREAGVAKKTRAQTEWCRRIWAEWAKSRCTHLKGEEKLHELKYDICEMTPVAMNFWLCRFILGDT